MNTLQYQELLEVIKISFPVIREMFPEEEVEGSSCTVLTKEHVSWNASMLWTVHLEIWFNHFSQGLYAWLHACASATAYTWHVHYYVLVWFLTVKHALEALGMIGELSGKAAEPLQGREGENVRPGTVRQPRWIWVRQSLRDSGTTSNQMTPFILEYVCHTYESWWVSVAEAGENIITYAYMYMYVQV